MSVEKLKRPIKPSYKFKHPSLIEDKGDFFDRFSANQLIIGSVCFSSILMGCLFYYLHIR